MVDPEKRKQIADAFNRLLAAEKDIFKPKPTKSPSPSSPYTPTEYSPSKISFFQSSSITNPEDQFENIFTPAKNPEKLHLALNTQLPSSSSSVQEEEEEAKENMANVNQNRTLRELAQPNLDVQPLCIQFPPVDGGFEVKMGLVNLLPKFHGLPGEDPNKHLRIFQITCSAQKPVNMTEEQVLLRIFPFSLEDAAKDWLYDLPPGSIETWQNMKRKFLERYFPASKASSIRKEICGIKQMIGETLYEYYERFKKLVASCPNHQIAEQLLIQYFYEGLLPADRSLLDAASGGALKDKTAEVALELISTMAENTQQFGTRQEIRRVHEVDMSSFDQRLNQLTSVVEKFVTNQISSNAQPVKSCGICLNSGHYTDMCPLLQEEECNAIGGFVGSNQRPQFQNWNNQQGFNSNAAQQPYQAQFNRPPGFQKPQQFQQRPALQQQSSPDEMKEMREMMKALITNQSQFQQETRTGMKTMENQIGQLATSLSKLEAQVSNNIPSQPQINPNIQNANAITLRSGRELTSPSPNNTTNIEPKNIEKNHTKMPPPSSHKPPEANIQPPPFPERVAKSKKEEEEKAILDTFKKVQINLPLLEAIKQVPKYAKFLKELCSNRRKLKGNERIQLGEQVSAVFQKKMPNKCKDPGSFSIPCTIGEKEFRKCMLDLGAALSVMSLSIYNKLNMGPLKPTGVILQLADRSFVYPVGVVEDVLVKVNELVFPADFYILDMNDEGSLNPTPILLGRPFLKTARTKIDVYAGTLTMEIDGDVVQFSLLDTMKHPHDPESLCSIEVFDDLDDLVQKAYELEKDDSLEVAIVNSLECEQEAQKESHELNDHVKDDVAALDSLPSDHPHLTLKVKLSTNSEKLLPSIVKAPNLELKHLPVHLKYVFLGEK